jgi:hypothetical protein
MSENINEIEKLAELREKGFSRTGSFRGKKVREGILEDYPAQTLGDAVDSFFRNPRWDHIRGEDGNDYVNITGKAAFSSSERSK